MTEALLCALILQTAMFLVFLAWREIVNDRERRALLERCVPGLQIETPPVTIMPPPGDAGMHWREMQRRRAYGLPTDDLEEVDF